MKEVIYFFFLADFFAGALTGFAWALVFHLNNEYRPHHPTIPVTKAMTAGINHHGLYISASIMNTTANIILIILSAIPTF
jgi:hypothetical protein